MRYRTALVALALGTAPLLGACGAGAPSAGPTDPGSSSASASADPTTAAPVADLAPKVLSRSELKSAMLTPHDVGPAFKIDTASSDGTSLGCLDKVGDIKLVNDTVREDSVEIAADTDFGLPSVYSAVATFRKVADAVDAMKAFRKSLTGCTKVKRRDADGTRYDLKVTHDDKTDPLADEQLNVSAGGTLLTSNVPVTIGFDLSMIRVGNNVLMAGFSTAGSTELRDETTAVVGLALPRLRAIMAGEPAPKGDRLGFKPLSVQDGIHGSDGSAV